MTLQFVFSWTVSRFEGCAGREGTSEREGALGTTALLSHTVVSGAANWDTRNREYWDCVGSSIVPFSTKLLSLNACCGPLRGAKKIKH
jgi:hypothetical protein